MKVICIDDVTDILNFGDGRKELTLYKEYEIIEKFIDYNSGLDSNRIQVSIINDLGVKNEYLLSRFVTREEFRELQLNELLTP
jgi:hypothetical protein